MANNKETKIIKLDSNSSIGCPYCGNGSRVNDLLFRTSEKIRVAEDNQLSDYYYRMYNKLPQGPGNKADARRLLSWTTLPASRITVKNGFVVEIENYDGDKVRERACPWCHNMIPFEWISRAGREVAIFGQPGTEDQSALFIRLLLQSDDNAQKTYGDLRSFLSGSSIIYDCTGLAKLELERKKRMLLCGMASKAVVFFLQMEAMNGKEEVMDLDTVDWLHEGVSEVYGASVINHPALIVLIPAAGDRVVDLERTHSVLINRLNVHFTDHRVCVWQSAQQLTQEFAGMAQWLTGSK
ncbi:MAG: hypothetical protein IJ198_14780 [Lachnospiraceae bacterium]|nr:hypothetical protein [Lachnospiraceae bacterium]